MNKFTPNPGFKRFDVQRTCLGTFQVIDVATGHEIDERPTLVEATGVAWLQNRLTADRMKKHERSAA